jgi:hypothetical protein
LIRRAKDGVRLLGQGEITGKLAFEVTGASQSAVKAVEAKGGTVTLKSITGRERPPGDAIKAGRRAAKREALAAKTAAKGSKKKAKGEQAEDTEAEKPAQKPAKGKPEPSGETQKAEGAAPKKPKADEGEAKKPKPAKTDKSE